MKYTYRVTTKGRSKDSTYLVFKFDRNLSTQNTYLSTQREQIPYKVRSLLAGVNRVKGVISGSAGEFNSSGLIQVDGNELTVKIIAVDSTEIPNIADRIVKRVQRRYAKGEPRQRMNLVKLHAELVRLNKAADELALLTGI